MQNIVLKRSLLISAAIFTAAILAPVITNAQPARAQEAQQSAQTRQESAQANAADRKDAVQTRLAEAKLKACEKRQKAITNIMSRLADRGKKQLDVFTKISDRTQAFYVSKGKTLANYDALVADVNAKKAAAETAVSALKDTSVEFKCDGEDPKGAASVFKESLKTEIAALKDYKTAVKNLIVGVKSVQGTTSSEGSQQ